MWLFRSDRVPTIFEIRKRPGQADPQLLSKPGFGSDQNCRNPDPQPPSINAGFVPEHIVVAWPDKNGERINKTFNFIAKLVQRVQGWVGGEAGKLGQYIKYYNIYMYINISFHLRGGHTFSTGGFGFKCISAPRIWDRWPIWRSPSGTPCAPPSIECQGYINFNQAFKSNSSVTISVRFQLARKYRGFLWDTLLWYQGTPIENHGKHPQCPFMLFIHWKLLIE